MAKTGLAARNPAQLANKLNKKTGVDARFFI